MQQMLVPFVVDTAFINAVVVVVSEGSMELAASTMDGVSA